MDIYIHLLILYYIYKPTKVCLVMWQTNQETIHVCLNSCETKVESKNSLKGQCAATVETGVVIFAKDTGLQI